MELYEILKREGQSHLIPVLDGLTEEKRKHLFEQLYAVDWEMLRSRGPTPSEGGIAPIQGLSVKQIEENREEFAEIGNAALARGEVAAVLLAGGAGTRLGADGPKGTFDIGITEPHSLYSLLIENLKRATEVCGRRAPLLIMTSRLTDSATRTFFREHSYFGYPKEKIFFFEQDTAPCVDLEGRLLLEDEGSLALSPNGNGGWYSSLMRSGLLQNLPEVKWFNVFSVDNPLQKMADPVFIGATIKSGAKSGAKVVSKAFPEERVGVLCNRGGRPSVIEYYELSPEMANLRDECGELIYRYGVILNYLFEREKLKEIAASKIPMHVVKKKIPYFENGATVHPQAENGYKFETLILDLVTLMGSCLPFEVVREHEFAPVKGRTGVDSVETARELLKRNGVIL